MFYCLAALSLLYYLLCCILYSPRSSILYFWPLLGAYFLLCNRFPLLWLITRIPFFAFWLLFFLFLAFAAKKKKEGTEVDALLVLGIRHDDTLPPALFLSRVRAAERILKENPKLSAVLSGGKVFTETETEAESLKRALIQRGIEPERLITEEKSRSTKENFLFSAPLFPEGVTKVLVVTGAYHSFRARLLAKACFGGKEALFYGTKAPPFFLPHLLLREFFTFSVDLLAGYIKLSFGGKK